MLAGRDIELVYGGAETGLMGRIADTFSFYSYRFRVLYSTLSFDYAYDFKNNNKHGTSLYLLLNLSKYIQDILQI